MAIVGAVAGGAALVALVTAWIATRPRGDRIGNLDLRAADAQLAVDGAAGDSLLFRTDAVINLSSLPGGSHEREGMAHGALRKSTLTLKLVDPSGAEKTTSCPIYDGTEADAIVSYSLLKQRGMNNTCVVPLAAAGRHVLRATAAWDARLVAHDARVEVRRVARK